MPDNLLIDAIRNDDLILVKELIDKHHCVDSPLFEEMTPLHYAIRLGRVEMAVALIRAKAKLEECYHDMTPLLLATISGQEEIVDCLIEAKANVNSRDKSSTCLENAVTQSYPSIAAKLIMAGANRSVNFKCLKTMNDLEFVRSLLPDSLLFNIPLKEIVKDKIVHFNEPGTTESYVNTSNPAAYLIENNLCSEVVKIALEVLLLNESIKFHEILHRKNDENAMSDAEVNRAKWHFEKNVKPYFFDTVSSKSSEQILFEIRKLILNEIYAEAKDAHDVELMSYIAENRVELMLGNENSLEKSIEIFTSETSRSQTAWRGFNPFAETVEWPNLLTPSSENQVVFSTGESSDTEMTQNMAYQALIEHVQYYYHAAIDPNDGDANLRKIRVCNFISSLHDIRNAHGIDGPACFPGSFSYIGMMGAFHQVVQMPPSIQDSLSYYIRKKAFKTFKQIQNEMPEIPSDDLIKAITYINVHTAQDVIRGKTRYKEPWLKLRTLFFEKLGTPESIYLHLKKKDQFPIVKQHCIYIKWYLSNLNYSYFQTTSNNEPVYSIEKQFEEMALDPYETRIKNLTVQISKTFIPNFKLKLEENLKSLKKKQKIYAMHYSSISSIFSDSPKDMFENILEGVVQHIVDSDQTFCELNTEKYFENPERTYLKNHPQLLSKLNEYLVELMGKKPSCSLSASIGAPKMSLSQ